jgi:tetratricopeptide (TPR) repeat protein
VSAVDPRLRHGAIVLALGLALAPATPAVAQTTQPATATAPATTPAPAPPPAPARPAPPPPRTLSPAELQQLKDVEEVERRYEEATSEHLARLKGILRREYDNRLRQLDQRYAKAIEDTDKEYRRRHLTAMELLKQFLAKYPNDPKWTPDAMFRLADLYLDKAKWDYDDKLAAGGADQSTALDENPDAPPKYAGPDYTASLDLWRDIVTRFPGYRQVDGTVYLLAYYLGEMRETARAKQAYLGLVCRNKYDPLATPSPPPEARDLRSRATAASERKIFVDPYQSCTPMKDSPELIDEAWVRVGEAHFDTRGELQLAIAAYKHVALNPKSKFYDIALYKLAWSYYRNNQYMEGIQAFDELVAYSDKLEDAGNPPTDLRKEAVQYLAISFSEPWEEGAQPDPQKSIERANAFYKNRTGERHVRDVYEQLGDTLKLSAGQPVGAEVPPEIQVAYKAAITAWRSCLTNWPLHPRNPVVHQKIVDTLAYMGDAEAAAEERARLAIAYKKDPPAGVPNWYAANETNREAMDWASRLGETSLIEAARTMHRNAQIAKQAWARAPTPQGKASYIALYARAAEMYRAYLQSYPIATEIYELTYRLADCLYFSEQYPAAVAQYRWVRDHQEIGTSHHDEAADSIVKAYEEGVRQAVAAGQIAEPPPPTAETLTAAAGKPLDLPRPYAELQAAYDEYAHLVPNDRTAPTKALAAAMISYRHFQVDDALLRFGAIMQKFCHSPEAVEAKEGMLAIYQSRNQHDRFQATADKFINDQCGKDKADVELAKNQKLSNDYQLAVKLFKDGRFEEAGDRFYGLYKTGSQEYKDRPGALFNAALAYEKAGKPKTAIKLYQEFTKIPSFHSSEYFIESLFRTAVSYQNAFDYEGAVDTFLAVVDEASKKGAKSRPEFNLEDSRLDAMYNAAFLRDLDRVYFDRGKNDPGAATLYLRYAAADVKNRDRARDAYYNAALVYEKAGSTKDMIKTFEAWKKTYGKDPGAGFKLVYAQWKIAKALEKARDKKGADDYFKNTIKAFDESGEKPGSPASELAAEAQFWLAEKFYKANFEPYKVKWMGRMDGKNADKTVPATVGALSKVAKDTSAGYQSIARFQCSWSLAAIVRLGDVSFFAGQKFIEAPVPAEITRLDQQYPDQGVLNDYQTFVENIVQPNTDTAKTQWLKALDTAKTAGVANEWSKLAQQRLNAYIASDLYQVQRDEMVDREKNP